MDLTKDDVGILVRSLRQKLVALATIRGDAAEQGFSTVVLAARDLEERLRAQIEEFQRGGATLLLPAKEKA